MKKIAIAALFMLASVHQVAVIKAAAGPGGARREGWGDWIRQQLGNANDRGVEAARAFRREMERRARERDERLDRRVNNINEQARQAELRGDRGLANNLRNQAFNMRQSGEDANERSRERLEKLQDQAAELGVTAWKGIIEVGKAEMLQDIERKKAVAVAHVQARQAKEASIENTKNILSELTRPRNAALVVGTVGAVLAIWKIGIPLLNRYLQLPTLAQETSLESWTEKGHRVLFGAPKLEKKVSDVILKSDLAEQVKDLAISLKNTVRNGGFFRNILLYGPPGTGKTMLAMRLARSSGLEYIYFAASSLNQFSAEDALKKLHELFDFAKHSSKKLMVIIDEAEKLFESRSAVKDSKTAMLLNFLLTFLGTQNRDFLVVALTNRPQDLDGAFLSRCDEKIEIHAPELSERLQILKNYLNKYLVESGRRVAQKSGLLSFLTKKPKRPRKLMVEEEVLDEDYLKDVAERLNGFVGRDIAKLVIGIQTKSMTRKDCCVTKEIFEQEVARMHQEALNKQEWQDSYAAVV